MYFHSRILVTSILCFFLTFLFITIYGFKTCEDFMFWRRTLPTWVYIQTSQPCISCNHDFFSMIVLLKFKFYYLISTVLLVIKHDPAGKFYCGRYRFQAFQLNVLGVLLYLTNGYVLCNKFVIILCVHCKM